MTEREDPRTPELHAALEALRASERARGGAREPFRAGLRTAFVAGRVEELGSVSRSLDTWPEPAADAAFRARLRERFVGLGVTEVKTRMRVTNAPARPRFARRQLVLAAAAMLMVALATFVVLRGGDDEVWHVVEGSPAGVSIVEHGTPVAFGTEHRLLRAFADGDCRVTTSGETLRVLREGAFLLTLTPDSDLRVLPRSGLTGEVLAVELTRGGLHVATGARETRVLRVITPDLEVELRGRAVAVDVYPGQGTCVCNLEGEATVRASNDAPRVEVEEGRMWFQRPGTVGSEAEMPSAHREPLEALLDVGRRHARWL